MVRLVSICSTKPNGTYKAITNPVVDQQKKDHSAHLFPTFAQRNFKGLGSSKWWNFSFWPLMRSGPSAVSAKTRNLEYSAKSFYSDQTKFFRVRYFRMLPCNSGKMKRISSGINMSPFRATFESMIFLPKWGDGLVPRTLLNWMSRIQDPPTWEFPLENRWFFNLQKLEVMNVRFSTCTFETYNYYCIVFFKKIHLVYKVYTHTWMSYKIMVNFDTQKKASLMPRFQSQRRNQSPVHPHLRFPRHSGFSHLGGETWVTFSRNWYRFFHFTDFFHQANIFDLITKVVKDPWYQESFVEASMNFKSGCWILAIFSCSWISAEPSAENDFGEKRLIPKRWINISPRLCLVGSGVMIVPGSWQVDTWPNWLVGSPRKTWCLTHIDSCDLLIC